MFALDLGFMAFRFLGLPEYFDGLTCINRLHLEFTSNGARAQGRMT